MAHLRGRLHITMRDLRSALSFMLIGNRDCSEIHALYTSGKHDDLVRSFYFNSWMGGGQATSDRLLTLLSDLDIGQQEDPASTEGWTLFNQMIVLCSASSAEGSLTSRC